jgi:putative nucleotidyltransferase with HDIG domain
VSARAGPAAALPGGADGLVAPITQGCPRTADFSLVGTVDERSRPGFSLWLSSIVVISVALAVSLFGPLSQASYGSPVHLFWVVTLGAGACLIAALATVVVGWHRGLAEVTILAAALAAQSGLALVHGITAPGVVYDANSAVTNAAFLALPFALVVAAPLMVDSGVSRAVGRHWRGWTLLWILLTSIVAASFLMAPSALPEATMGSPVAIMVGLFSLAVAMRLSWRQLELYWISRRTATLVAALALAYLGLTGLVWTGRQAFNLGWWFIHGLDIAAILAAVAALAFGYRQNRGIEEILAPVLAREPLVALRLGLSPLVHRFVADLNAKDAITRGHVIRVAELAMRTGTHAGVPARRLRWLGIAALLHDIGKLDTPSEILTKPGRLSDEETVVMRQHAAYGAAMLAQHPELAPAAPLVRAHHERVDGGGYPDGLHSDAIPLEARIISVCDAFDAMAHTRHYRVGMGVERAIAVLREHAGSQWDPLCVAAVVAEVTRNPEPEPSPLIEVGRADLDESVLLGCVPTSA